MKRTFCLAFIITCILLLFSACKKCIENQLPSDSFSQNELQMIPYKGLDTLVFISQTEPTIYYYGEERYTLTGINFENPDRKEETKCKGTYYYTLGSWINFQTIKGDGEMFRPHMYFTNLFESGFIEKIFALFLFVDYDSIRGFDGQYVCGLDTIYNGKYIEGGGTLIKKFYSSYQLGSKTYSRVYELDGNYGSPIKNEWISSVFYCFHEGLVGFSTNKGKLWYLK